MILRKRKKDLMDLQNRIYDLESLERNKRNEEDLEATIQEYEQDKRSFIINHAIRMFERPPGPYASFCHMFALWILYRIYRDEV